MPTDRALRPTVALGTSGLKRGRAAPEAIGELKLGAAPEVDRHTLQLSEPPPSHGHQPARHELS